MMLSSQSYRYAVLLIILASSHSFSITSYRSCPLKCCYNNDNNNHYNRHSNNKKVVSLQLLNNDLDKDIKIKTESNQFIPVQTIALVANDKRQYYYSILLFVSLLSCLKLFDNSNNDIISNRIIDSFTNTSSYWRYFVCGAISCSISHVITVPFDVIKTKIQTNSKDNNNNIIISSSSLSTTSDTNSSDDTSPTSTGSNNSMIVMTKRIIADEGISGLFTGVIPTFIGFSIQGALKYGFFEVFKPLVKASIIAYHMNHDHTLLNSDDNDNTVLSLFSLSQLDIISILIVSAASAELIGSFFLTPFEAIRIRQVSATATSPATSSSTTSTDHQLQQQQQQENQKSDIITFISTIITNEGVSSLFLGLPAIMLKAIPYTAVQLSCFELCSTAFYQTLFDSGFSSSEALQYKYLITTISAVIAAIISSIISQPGDTLLSFVNKSTKTNNTVMLINSERREIEVASIPVEIGIIKKDKVNALQIIYDTSIELGVIGLFKGLQARLIHVIFIVVIQLLIYDSVKQLVGIPVTGFH